MWFLAQPGGEKGSSGTTDEDSFRDDNGLRNSDIDRFDIPERMIVTSISNVSTLQELEEFPGGETKAKRRGSHVSFADGVGDQTATVGKGSMTGDQTRPAMRRGSLRESLARESLAKENSRRNSILGSLRLENGPSLADKMADRNFSFYCVVVIIPCIVSVWYCAAILFPPALTKKNSLIFWDEGKLRYNDQGRPTICPYSSICSEGVLQIVLIATARISAFASYVFMGVTFLSKMHFLIHFLASSYLSRFVPFSSLHHVHTANGKIFAGLAFIHTISHYLRYILRRDVNQLSTQVHITGLIAILSMVTVVLAMSSVAKRFKNSIGKFERRLNAHWIFIILCIALCLHHGRTRVITLTFFGLWSLDYLYGLIFSTHSLEVVELLPLSDSSGVQMLFRNPNRFRPKSGEYIKIQLPWLTHGGNEWHPFSIYLRESTEQGWKSVHGYDQVFPFKISSASRGEFKSALTMEEFIRITLLSEYQHEAIDAPSSLLVQEARKDLRNRFPTTQVFINPVGDWSKGLLKDVREQKQLRACWVRGPYKSPYSIAHNFSHLVLTASGIGITPALGVMGQYPGFSRSKILVWLVRDSDMLKFFAPLIKDAHIAVVFYTGKEKLKSSEVRKITSNGNIFIQQSRPASLPGAIGNIIVQFENHLNLSKAKTVEELAIRNRTAWCILYCGGSARIKDDLHQFSKSSRVKFEYEMFDW